MRHFLKKVLVFATVIFLFTSALLFCSIYLLRSREQKLLRAGAHIHILFSGDSNIESAVNDSLIKNSLNIAQSGEAYLYTYEKIRSFCRVNKQINVIFLGFSYIDLLKSTEDRWLFNPLFIIEKISHYNCLLTYKESCLIFENNPKAFFRGLMEGIIKNLNLFIKSFSSERLNTCKIHFGGYEYVTRDGLEEDIKQSKYQSLPPERSLIQVKYLKLISEYCRQRSIKLILLNTPKHSYFNEKINKAIRQNWNEVYSSLLPDSLLDMSAMCLPDSCFSDQVHLNYKGARLFSGYLNEKINSGETKGKVTTSSIIPE